MGSDEDYESEIKRLTLDGLRFAMEKAGRPYKKKPVTITAFVTEEPIEIATLEGIMRAAPGDFIVRGVAGEFYSVKPHIFRELHEIPPND